MAKKMIAVFTDKAYSDLMCGKAVDNNGFRSDKGFFYPDQPTFQPINERGERIKDAVHDLEKQAGEYLFHRVLLPGVKRFCDERIYPYICEKWDNWQARRRTSNTNSNALHDKQAPTTNIAEEVHCETQGNVIDFAKHRKASNE